MIISLRIFLPILCKGEFSIHCDALQCLAQCLMLNQSSLNEWTACRTISRKSTQGPIHVRELPSSGKGARLSHTLKPRFCDPYLIHPENIGNGSVQCIAMSLAYLYLSPEQIICQQVNRERILSAVCCEKTCLINELALNNRELRPLYGERILLSFTAKAMGIVNAELMLT